MQSLGPTNARMFYLNKFQVSILIFFSFNNFQDPDDCFGGQDCYDIHPTPTLKPPTAPAPPWPPPLPSIPDERYWIVTILRTQAAEFYLTPAELEPRLARLYQIAFRR